MCNNLSGAIGDGSEIDKYTDAALSVPTLVESVVIFASHHLRSTEGAAPVPPTNFL